MPYGQKCQLEKQAEDYILSSACSDWSKVYWWYALSESSANEGIE